jgi:hypothetical protein
MKYFEITDWFEQPGRWHLGPPKNRSGIELDPRLFIEGNEYRGGAVYPRIAESGMKDYSLEIPFVIPIREGAKPLDFTLGSFQMPVVTERIGEHLESCCGDAIQLIPVEIPGIDRRFQILNALRVVDAVDRKKSEISWRTKEDTGGNRFQTFDGISRLIVKETEIAGARIFRLKDWELPLIVDETVKDVLESLRTTGIKFDEISTV